MIRIFLLGLENKIKENMIIDNEFFKDLMLNIKLLNLNVYSKKGTLGIFVFIGLNSVGKTKLDILSEELKMPKIDTNMAEYSFPYELNSIIGYPLGYSPNDENSKLFNFLNKYLSSILVLSDFHNASKRMIDFFMKEFKTGKLSDNLGKIISLRENLVIININLEYKDSSSIRFKNNSEYFTESEIFLEKRFLESLLDLIDHVFFLNHFKKIILIELLLNNSTN